MSSSIRSRSKRWQLFIVLLVLWGLVPRPAVGAELTEEAKAQARVKFNEGNAAYEQGDFRKALAAFEEAYQLAPLPGFFFNLAQCHRQLGDYERAAFFYRCYLTLSEEEPANAAVVKELIAEMDSQAKQDASGRVGRGKPVQAKAVAKDRPEAAPTQIPEARGEPKRERGGLEEAERRGLDIRTSHSPSVARKSLPPAAVPAVPAPKVREPLTRKWWVWAGVGAAVLATGGIVYAITSPDPRPATLGTIPAR